MSDDFNAKLKRYLAGEMPPEEKAAFEAEAETDEDKRLALSNALRQQAIVEGGQPLPPGYSPGLFAALTDPAEIARTRRAQQLGMARIVGATLAGALLIGLALLLFRPGRQLDRGEVPPGTLPVFDDEMTDGLTGLLEAAHEMALRQVPPPAADQRKLLGRMRAAVARLWPLKKLFGSTLSPCRRMGASAPHGASSGAAHRLGRAQPGGDHRGGSQWYDRARVLGRWNHAAFDVDMGIDQARRQVRALEIDHRSGFVVAEPDDSRAHSGDAGFDDFATQYVDYASVVEQ